MFFRKVVIAIFIFCTSSILGNDLLSKYSQKYITYAYLANRIYNEGSTTLNKIGFIFNQKWKLIDYISKKNGFQAGVYKNIDTKEYIFVIGGTTANPKEVKTIPKIGGDVLDVLTDLRLLSNIWPDSQSKSALDYYNKMKKYYTIKAIVGHSLGGGLAAYVGLYSNIPAYTFNPSPVPFTRDSFEPFLNAYSITYPNGVYSKNKEFRINFAHSDKITNIMSDNDPISNISFLLENTDSKYYNKTDSSSSWNRVKKYVLAIPKEVHLDYANVGKNIWLPIKTGHSMESMLNKMIEAKKEDDYNRFIKKWGYLDNKIKELEKAKFTISIGFYKNKELDYNYPNKNAIEYFVITNMRKLFNSTSKQLGKNEYYRFNSSFIKAMGYSENNSKLPDDFIDIDSGISYYKYMKIADSMYKKLFGKAFFVKRYILSKNKSWYKIYKTHFEPMISDKDKKILYKHIFLLHFVSGIPKKYLKDDSQKINNAFWINFFYKFYKNVIKYRDIKLGN